MADPERHYARWKRNADLAAKCGATLDSDWEIVLRFYSVLHLVEGYMRTKAERFWSERHGDRSRHLRESPEVKGAAGSYRDLQDLSEQIRYDPEFAPQPADLANAKGWATKVESFVRSKLEARLVPTKTGA